MNIETALKLGSYILMSLGILFFLSCLMDNFFHQLSGSTYIFVKNTHKKSEILGLA